MTQFYRLPQVQKYFNLRKVCNRIKRSFQSQSNRYVNELLNIVYEDKQLIIVNKPCGLLCQSDQTNDNNHLLKIIKDHIKLRDDKLGDVYLSMVHRLDKITSGLVMFAKNSKAKIRLDKQFRDRLIIKKYLAAVEGLLDQSQLTVELNDYIQYRPVRGSAGGHSVHATIAKIPSSNMSENANSVPIKLVPAKLSYSVLGYTSIANKKFQIDQNTHSVLDIILMTGNYK